MEEGRRLECGNRGLPLRKRTAKKKLAPIHPGEHLSDILKESGITANAPALRLRVPANRITTIVQGKRSITAETALRLGRYFGTSPESWMNLQTKYDLDSAQDGVAEQIAQASDQIRVPKGIELTLSVGYSECLDAAPPHSAELTRSLTSAESSEQRLQPELYLKELSGLEIDEFWRAAEADSVGLGKDDLAKALLALGIKYNYGQAPGTAATRAQIGAFWRTLQLQDLALAHACALGRDAAWQQFMARFREFLTQAAISITGSVALGQELADSLYGELFGLTERGEQRRSPLAYYSGRGSLKGFLRATLAQRNVDHHRRASRETPITNENLAAASPTPIPTSDVLSSLCQSLTITLGSLEAEERFLLSAWFLDRRTLLEVSHILRVHEATVSRRLQRLTARLHKELLKNLRVSGMSRAAAEEALGTDPRDLDINLRTLLQASRPATFLQQGASADPEQT